METIRKTRVAYQRDRKTIRQIAREFTLSRNTVKKVLRGNATEFTYDRKTQPNCDIIETGNGSWRIKTRNAKKNDR